MKNYFVNFPWFSSLIDQFHHIYLYQQTKTSKDMVLRAVNATVEVVLISYLLIYNVITYTGIYAI